MSGPSGRDNSCLTCYSYVKHGALVNVRNELVGSVAQLCRSWVSQGSRTCISYRRNHSLVVGKREMEATVVPVIPSPTNVQCLHI